MLLKKNWTIVAPKIIMTAFPYLPSKVFLNIRIVIGPVGVRNEMNPIRKGRIMSNIIKFVVN